MQDSRLTLNLINCEGFTTHRSGWSYVLKNIQHLHGLSGIYVDDFIEKTFSWNLEEYYEHQNFYKIPYRFPWIGFVHNPPNIPEWFDTIHSPQAILKREIFQESLKYCRCLIALSEYLANWLRDRVSVPVISLKHPTETSVPNWTPYNRSKNILQIGYWLRNFKSFELLESTAAYHKIWIPSNIYLLKYYQDYIHRSGQKYHADKSVKILNRIENKEYDILLKQSVGFLNLYDSSANNAIIEMMARNMPFVVNKLPAIVEYLGEDYPLYFHSLDYASKLLIDRDKIHEAHIYLRDMNKEWLDSKYFACELTKKLKEVL